MIIYITDTTMNVPLIQRFQARQHRRDDWNGRHPLQCSILEGHQPSLSEHPLWGEGGRGRREKENQNTDK